MSSSLAFVASLRLRRSVALSRLLRLSADISFCRAVAILVKLMIWLERLSSACGARTRAVESFVTFARGVDSRSLCECVGVDIFCNANMVADCGGVFSPRILCWARRAVGRTIGVMLGPGVMVMAFSSFSSDLGSKKGSFRDARNGVDGLLDLSGDLDEDDDCPDSSIKLRSRTLPGCSDCMRR